MLADDLDGAETVLDEATELLDTLTGARGAGLLWLRLADIRVRRGDLARRARARASGRSRTPTCGRDEAVSSARSLARHRVAGRRPRRACARSSPTPSGGSSGFAPARPEQGHARRFVARAAGASWRSRTATSSGAARWRRAGDRTGGGDDRHADRRHGGAWSRRSCRLRARARRGRRRAARRRRRAARGGGPLQPRGGARCYARDRRPRGRLRARPRR